MGAVYYRFNKDSNEWDIIPASDKLDTDLKISPELIRVLDQVKLDLQKDRDVGCVIFGPVGSGKSTLGRLCCRYISNETFRPKLHMVRDVNDIKDIIRNAKKGDCVIFDEASGIFGSADTNTKKTKYAQLVLDVCRQKNLFLVIIAPQFHRLTAPVALDRTTFAIRTFFKKGTNERGIFCFYGTRSKAALYSFAKKFYGKINVPRIKKWYGNFGDDVMFKDEYVAIKDETLNLVLDSFGGKKEDKKKTQAQIKKDFRKDIIKNNMDKPIKTLMEILGIGQSTVDYLRKEIRDEYKEKALINSIGKENVKDSIT